MTRFDGAVAPVAVAERSGFDESVHHGAGVAIDGEGTVLASIGDPDLLVYPRSSLKPLQAHAMVDLGFDGSDEQLALVCASHDGSERHLAVVRSILDRYGLQESDLQNTPSRPLAADARAAARTAGIGPSSIQQNCSGKHAAMLATCVVNGWPTDRYLDLDHPLQVAITASMVDLGCAIVHVGIDGCGAPTHVMSLRHLAWSFSRLAAIGQPVARAMAANPVLVAGPDRDVTRWMSAVTGLIAKEGAAGVMVAATADGRATAFKIAGGSEEGRSAVMPEALAAIGVDVDGAASDTRAALAVTVTGHGRVVGYVRALEWTSWSS